MKIGLNHNFDRYRFVVSFTIKNTWSLLHDGDVIVENNGNFAMKSGYGTNMSIYPIPINYGRWVI